MTNQVRCTWGNQLVGSQILLVRLQAGVELDHDTDVFSQPLVRLSGKFGSDATSRQRAKGLEASEVALDHMQPILFFSLYLK